MVNVTIDLIGLFPLILLLFCFQRFSNCSVVYLFYFSTRNGSLLVSSVAVLYVQIKLLKILALLGSSDKKASEQMYTIVGDIMRKSDSTSNIGNAILYECICCVSSIHPNPKVLESAAEAVAKFLKVCLLYPPACIFLLPCLLLFLCQKLISFNIIWCTE